MRRGQASLVGLWVCILWQERLGAVSIASCSEPLQTQVRSAVCFAVVQIDLGLVCQWYSH